MKKVFASLSVYFAFVCWAILLGKYMHLGILKTALILVVTLLFMFRAVWEATDYEQR